MPMVLDSIDTVAKAISDAIIEEAREAVKAGGQVIEGIVRQNIMERGQRGGNSKYAPVPVFWLRKRATWPDASATGKLTSGQAAYVRDHYPLKDTGRMIDSVQSKPVSGQNSVGVEVAPTVDYAVNHELGTADIRKRPFMFISDTDDVNRVVNAIESAFLFRQL